MEYISYVRKTSDGEDYYSADVKTRYQVTPEEFIDLKALMGDKSDNIPGVAGVGEKSAMTLLAQFKDLDGIYSHIDEIKGALQTKLINGKEDAYFSKTLATIDIQSPIEVTLADCVLKMPFSYALREKFAELEFKSLLSKNIFLEAESEQMTIENIKQADDPSILKKDVEEVLPASIQEAVQSVQAHKGNAIGVDWRDDAFRFCVIQDEKYIELEV